MKITNFEQLETSRDSTRLEVTELMDVSIVAQAIQNDFLAGLVDQDAGGLSVVSITDTGAAVRSFIENTPNLFLPRTPVFAKRL